MATKFPEMKDGDELTIDHMNLIFRELERWQKLTGSGLIGVDGADARTPPRIVDYRGDSGLAIRAWFPTGIPAATNFATPGSVSDVTIAVRSGNGWTTTGGIANQVVYNSDLTAVSGAKAGWVVQRDDGTWELLVADC